MLPILFIVAASLTGCLTRDSGASSESPGTTDESRSSVASQEKARDYIFDTPEDTVVETPWFTVSSIILQVQRTQPETVIVAPPDSRSQRILALRPGSVYPTTTIPGNRFLFHLGIITDDAPPFTTTPERLRQSEPYE
ncbi:MAG: hypothetical protein ACOCU4_06235 [Alkalispirochaeta sp.]